MAKKTQLDLAIEKLEAEIAVKQAALDVLREQRASMTRKPRTAPLLSEVKQA